MTVRLARIDLFPVKSFDALTVGSARVLPNGALRHDRRYALLDADGKLLNGKRTPLVHPLELAFDDDATAVTVRDRRGGGPRRFALSGDLPALETRLSEHFGQPVTLAEDAAGGFPDDALSPGPTVIGAETLATVADWFGLSPDDARRRFRANLILEGGGPFWEDRLFGAPGETVTFRIGGLMFFGTSPCARCVVPSRDPATGEAVRGFAKAFAARRRETRPDWADADAFDHHFRLAVNTRYYAPDGGGTLAVGDAVEILG